MIVEYALRDANKPLCVSTYQSLPKQFLPTGEELEAELLEPAARRVNLEEDS